MGIVERVLADFDLSDGTDCTIELNKTETIHLHVDNVRIDMTPEELRHFAEVVSQGKENLIEVKELDR
ncbi:hypothetical protein CV102_10375 [Natronococcus pandeyae]|uniref:Uncharacterized protein n=1 Tax=Natronococcus pandeyae TaxID=2055836 RepID=A0A8J8TSL6_9EURY|nr:hypothetical protein [Natronococcus pandeyae]TYL38904.1 hypothetical protein CV102_10375 [Natronococcus pandeyae]